MVSVAAPWEILYRPENLNLSQHKTNPKVKPFAAAYVTSLWLFDFFSLHDIDIGIEAEIWTSF